MKGCQTYPLITHPFGINDVQRPAFSTTYDPTRINYPLGLPPAMSVLGKMGGTRLDRHMMNQLAYLSTVGGFMTQIGANQTFEKSVSDAIGGYAKGTVLRDMSLAYADANTVGKYSVVRDVVSLQDNNDKNFVYDAVENPYPYVIGSTVDGVVWWKYVEDETSYTSLKRPNSQSSEIIMEETTYSTVADYEYTYTAAQDEWIHIIMRTPLYHFNLDGTFLGWFRGDVQTLIGSTAPTVYVSQQPIGSITTATAAEDDFVVYQQNTTSTSSTGTTFTKTRYRYFWFTKYIGASAARWMEIDPSIETHRCLFIDFPYPDQSSSYYRASVDYNTASVSYSWMDGIGMDLRKSNDCFVADFATPYSSIAPLNKGSTVTLSVNILNTRHPIMASIRRLGFF